MHTPTPNTYHFSRKIQINLTSTLLSLSFLPENSRCKEKHKILGVDETFSKKHTYSALRTVI